MQYELNSFGISAALEARERKSNSTVHTAFLKMKTKENALLFFSEEFRDRLHRDETTRIKMDVETSPPAGAGFEHVFKMRPAPFEARLYDLPSLFAGKLHAILCRPWVGRVKGRDLYDYLFYLRLYTGVNLRHLRARMIQSGHIEADAPFTLETVKTMLQRRFAEIDYTLAQSDVKHFIAHASEIEIWSARFFTAVTKELRAAPDSLQTMEQEAFQARVKKPPEPEEPGG